MNKKISTRAHGAIDYLFSAALFAVPRVLDWSSPITALTTTAAGIGVIYSLLTRYELGTLRVLPMRVHLMLDVLVGITLCSAPLLLQESPTVVAVCLGFGITALVVTSFTPSFSPTEARRRKPTRSQDEERHAERAA